MYLTGLDAKLQAAKDALSNEDTASACVAFQDFVNQVQALSGEKKLAEADAVELTAAAMRLMERLECAATP